MDITFSLIMATYNRKQEVEKFIISLLDQDFDIKKVELIIVDQNEKNFLNEIIEKYKNILNIIHVRSSIVGLSKNRNIGIKKAKGEIIAFPDDDCLYYRDTLSSVYKFFSQKNVNTILGQVFDRKKSEKIIRQWPDKTIKVKENNFFFLYTSITIFTRNTKNLFDINLGLNAPFGSYEDADYILSLIKSDNKGIFYYPNIQVNHPKLDIRTMSLNKIHSYGMGFGAFCRKNISPYIFFLFLGVLVHHLIKLLQATVTMNWPLVEKRYVSILSRIKGFFFFSSP